MDQLKIDIFNAIIEAHPQFTKKSNLFDEIVVALDCTYTEARDLARTHCNMVSFYACIRAGFGYNKSYRTFFKHCLSEKVCNEKGRIFDKPKLLDTLGIKSDLTTYREYEDIIDPYARLNPDKFYQVKIFANTSGDHFMGCYIKNGQLYLSDTSYRGIEIPAIKYINPENFQKISEVI